jgi:hypothetical protein
LAPAADAMHLLRHIDHLKPSRKRAHQILRLNSFAIARADNKLDGVFGIARAAPDSGLSIAFDQLKELFAALVAQHLADEATK